MTGKPGKDARAALKRPAIFVPIIVALVVGTLIVWLLHLRLP
jgi:uncharacterized membrane protein